MLPTPLLITSFFFCLPWHSQNLFRISCSQRSNCFCKVHLVSKSWHPWAFGAKTKSTYILLQCVACCLGEAPVPGLWEEVHSSVLHRGKWWNSYYIQDIMGLSIQKGTSQALWFTQLRKLWKWVPGDTLLALPCTPCSPAGQSSQHPTLLTLTSSVTMETPHCQGNFLTPFHLTSQHFSLEQKTRLQNFFGSLVWGCRENGRGKKKSHKLVAAYQSARLPRHVSVHTKGHEACLWM